MTLNGTPQNCAWCGDSSCIGFSFVIQRQRYQCKEMPSPAVFTIATARLTWKLFSQSAVHIDIDMPYSLHPAWFICPFCVLNCIRPKTLKTKISANITHISHDDYACLPSTDFVICFLTLPFITRRDENVKQMTSLLHIDFFLPTRTLNLIKTLKSIPKKRHQ